ncbi:phenylacetic acid degradation operon negative regulatory protein [Amycolatopsis arida]|uniref:Phenylacetic acid degradation operon negative regulatory protein n=1 Tax=Amycolatopsis arida TaxID=587909 RepID=A0A1I5P661_9PSEU|nr:PaaX family transcriptional regulator C-terminal domain-containing protein [Amycolatopsis arida]TDX98355.1 phenylacetic acid degradation operon negative regulatory protein [Amycolatopsis arida]SFP28966.1 phenylacetic acid degradation operon negative regulatory protein [Amycolatopsis arida]
MDPFEPAPQELVVTLLGGYVRPRDRRTVWSGGLVALLGELGFSAGAARIALGRLVRRGLLDRHRDGRLVHLGLTPRAVALLEDGDRRIFSFGRAGPAPGEWTMLWHGIPEGHRHARERLVRRLRFLGFGTLGDGTWIAPRDRVAEVTALLDELGVREHAGLLRGRPVADVGSVVARAWDLAGLARRYAEFVDRFAGSAVAPDRLSDARAFEVRTRLVHAFRQFPVLDPELPADLVSPPPRRAEAVALFSDLYGALAEPAQRHFDRAVSISTSQRRPPAVPAR